AAENLQATEEEINAEIQELSETYNMPIEQIKEKEKYWQQKASPTLDIIDPLFSSLQIVKESS
ncbi:hypothetical protein EFP6CTSP_16730, partial [Enterococcus faecium]